MGRSRHKAEVHNEQRHKCQICSKTFNRMSSVQLHMAKVHKSCKCEVCLKTFGSVKSLAQHISKCHEKNGRSKCEVCLKTFASAKRLDLHTSKFHEKKACFKCELCSKTFAIKRHLKSHMSRAHKDGENGSRDVCLIPFSKRNTSTVDEKNLLFQMWRFFENFFKKQRPSHTLQVSMKITKVSIVMSCLLFKQLLNKWKPEWNKDVKWKKQDFNCEPFQNVIKNTHMETWKWKTSKVGKNGQIWKCPNGTGSKPKYHIELDHTLGIKKAVNEIFLKSTPREISPKDFGA